MKRIYIKPDEGVLVGDTELPVARGRGLRVRLPVDARATLVDVVLRFEGEGAYLEVPSGTEVFDAQ